MLGETPLARIDTTSTCICAQAGVLTPASILAINQQVTANQGLLAPVINLVGGLAGAITTVTSNALPLVSSTGHACHCAVLTAGSRSTHIMSIPCQCYTERLRLLWLWYALLTLSLSSAKLQPASQTRPSLTSSAEAHASWQGLRVYLVFPDDDGTSTPETCPSSQYYCLSFSHSFTNHSAVQWATRPASSLEDRPRDQ